MFTSLVNLCIFLHFIYFISSQSKVMHFCTETVLTCQWKADFLSCSVLSGYVFDNKVTSHLTLSIPKARKDHEGTYSCQTEGAVSLPFKNCSFSLKKGNNLSSYCYPMNYKLQPFRHCCCCRRRCCCALLSEVANILNNVFIINMQISH